MLTICGDVVCTNEPFANKTAQNEHPHRQSANADA